MKEEMKKGVGRGKGRERKRKKKRRKLLFLPSGLVSFHSRRPRACDSELLQVLRDTWHGQVPI